MMRQNFSSLHEVRDILMAAAALTVALSLLEIRYTQFVSGSILNNFLYILPAVALTVVLSFIIHELMHKFVAQKYGAVAAFQASPFGLVMAIVTGALGFLFAAPGATVIFTNSFTRRENGIVSLAGPIINFAVFLGALSLFYVLNPSSSSYLALTLSIMVTVSVILAFFNMLPIFPLDGSKVLAWNKPLYFSLLGVILVLMIFFVHIPLYSIILMLMIAFFFSFFYRMRF